MISTYTGKRLPDEGRPFLLSTGNFICNYEIVNSQELFSHENIPGI